MTVVVRIFSRLCFGVLSNVTDGFSSLAGFFFFFFFRFRPRVNSYRNGALSCPSPPLLDRVQLCRNIIFLCVKASFCGISKALKNRLEAASSTTSGIFCFPESYLISLSFSYKFKNVLFLRIGVDTIVSSFRSQFL